MKKLPICILVLVLAGTLLFSAFAAEESVLPKVCEHCGVAVTWTPLTADEVRSTSSLTTGHYYVDMEEDSYESVVKTINAQQQVCLYLNGKTLAGTTRGINIKSGGTLNIMGSGKITGRGTTAGVNGACCIVEAGGTLNQYGGTLSYVEYKERHAINGGVVYVSGTYNLYDGVVENGITKQYQGGNIYVNSAGVFNMYGGTVRSGTAEYAGGNMYVHAKGIFRFFGGSITGGTAKVAGNSVYNRGVVYLSGDAICNEIFMNSNVEGGGPAMADMIVIEGDFSGDVTVNCNSASAGMDIGNAENGTISGNLRVSSAMLSGQISEGNIILVSSGYCDNCQKTVVWEALPAEGTFLSSGHYYAEADINGFVQKYIYVGDTVCVNLNGKTVKASTRAFSVYPGGILNIVGGGNLIGSGSTEKTPNGGVMNIVKGGTVNLYNATLSYEESTENGVKPGSNGGIVNIGGTLNMYGGTLKGGVATNAGGTVFVEITGVLNISGGVVEMGKMGANGTNSCIYSRGTTVLSGDPVVAQLLQKPNVADGGPALGDMLVLRDSFTGQADIRCSGLAVGLDMGNVENADFANANIKINGTTAWKFAQVGGDLLATKGEKALVVTADGIRTGYADLAAALEAVDGISDRIVLLASTTEAVTLTKDIQLDVNGFEVSGLAGGKTVYVADAMTDDYTVVDGICGTVSAGDCKILPAAGYMLVEEDGKISSHRVSFKITAMSLRQREAGLYFTAEFAGDEAVASRIQGFGVALNAKEMPDGDNMDTTSLYSAYAPSQWVCGKAATATGTMLKGIMDVQNSAEVNQNNANTLVYGSAYIKTADGYLFDSALTIDLQGFLEMSDENWSTMTGNQKNSAFAFYSDFSQVLDSWELPNLKREKADNERFALVEKTPTMRDVALLESIYAGTKAYRGELHDHAATGGTSDGKQPLEVWKAYMKELQMDFAAIVDHRQVLHMRLEQWDNAIFIGGSEASTTITDREGVAVHYNMTFARPEGFEIVLKQFPEFGFRIWSESDREGCGGQMHFNYPKFTGARFTELCEAVYANGGFVSIVHPKAPGYVDNEDPVQGWFADYTGVEVFYTYNGDRNNAITKANYGLWTGMLAAGKKVFATSGHDAHNMPSETALSTIYSPEKDSSAYVQKLREGNFTAGPVGIRMAVGETPMGGTVDFTGNRLVFSIGDFHKSVYKPDHTFRVDLISNEGIVFSQSVSCEEMTFFAIDTQEVDFYRVEVWDTTENAMLALGNPIWNAK